MQVTMSADQGHILLPLARAAIARELGIATPAPATAAAWLQQPGSAFVTLSRDSQLRGRNGSLIPVRPLREDVTANAIAAAFRDLRFQPLTAAELDMTRIEVSVLSALESLDTNSEAVVLAQLRPGVDGLVFRYGHHRSTFLPEAWSQYAEAEEFLAQLKYRAGLPPDFWDAAVELQRYTVDCWREEDL